MFQVDPARSEVADLRGMGELYLRRQCSLMVMRIRFERAIGRLRLLAPDTGEALRAWLDRIDEIALLPSGSQLPAVSALLDEFERWSRGPLTPPPREPPVDEVVAAPPAEPEPEAPAAGPEVADDVPHPLPDELEPVEPPIASGRSL